jgi:hypothetical protein
MTIEAREKKRAKITINGNITEQVSTLNIWDVAYQFTA